MKLNPISSDPAINALAETCEHVRKSLHQAVERGDWPEVQGLAKCMVALERSLASLAHIGGR